MKRKTPQSLQRYYTTFHHVVKDALMYVMFKGC